MCCNEIPRAFAAASLLARILSIKSSIALRLRFADLEEGPIRPTLRNPLDALFEDKFALADWPDEEGDWEAWLLRGGFAPALAARDSQARSLWFAGYVQTYLERDLRTLSAVASLPDFSA